MMENPPLPRRELPTARQIRAFRAWLGLSQIDFATQTGIGAATVYEIEAARREPRKSTRLAITAVMQASGVTLEGGVMSLPS